MTIQYCHDYRVPCVVMRGGTTRGYFFQPHDIPHEPAIRDQLFLDIVAGQDLRPADGLGGNDMLLNKVVQVRASDRVDVDIERTDTSAVLATDELTAKSVWQVARIPILRV